MGKVIILLFFMGIECMSAKVSMPLVEGDF